VPERHLLGQEALTHSNKIHTHAHTQTHTQTAAALCDALKVNNSLKVLCLNDNYSGEKRRRTQTTFTNMHIHKRTHKLQLRCVMRSR